MGFQFNHVGGGTKTRRPITLHMKYNSSCVQPNCFLVTDEHGEQEISLEELQVCILGQECVRMVMCTHISASASSVCALQPHTAQGAEQQELHAVLSH